MAETITTECPPPGELERLVRGRCTEARSSALCDHVSTCPACQKRLDALNAPAAELADHLRTATAETPATDSAYWRALGVAEEELRRTALFTSNGLSDTPIPDDLKLDFLQPTDTPDRLGKLARFDVVRVVGRGGMGVVLHAYDPSLDRDVAIKVIDPHLAHNEVARQRFCREARAAAAVTHDNIVAVHQVNEDEPSGLPYLVMQLVNGESLEQRIRRAGKLSAGEVAKLGMQAAAGLAAAHAGGLIHRDIKPANILLEGPADRVKLTDFGLARAAADVKITRTGFVAGSPLYMAPEQARGDEVDPRADLFSLGSVLYEAATGTAPFEAKTPLAVLRRVSDETQMPLMRINRDVPKWLSDVVDRLLQKEPQDRIQTAAEVAEIFAAGLAEMYLLSPLDVPAEVCAGSRTATTRARKHICWKAVGHRALPWAGGALAGALVIGLLWAFTGNDKPAPVVLEPQPNGVVAVAPPAEAGPEPKVVLRGATGAVGSVWALTFLSSNELVVGQESGALRIWDLRTAAVSKALEQPEGNIGNVWSADVSADGKLLMTASDDSAVTFWDLDMLRVKYTFPESVATKTATFSPCKGFLATGNRNSTVKIWDWENLNVLVQLKHRGTVHALAYSPDGKRLASAGSDGKVRVWDVKEAVAKADEAPRPAFELGEHQGAVYAVAFSPDGAKIVTAGWDGSVRVWDATNGRQLRTIPAHEFDARSVSFGNGGKWVASAGPDGAKVWEVDTGKEVFAYRSSRPFHVVRFAPDGTTLAAGGRDGTVRVWDVKK